MRYVFAVASLFMLTWLAAAGQQNDQTIHQAEAGLTAPVLLPSNLTVSTQKRCYEFDGFVKYSATIDATGLPHVLKMLEASDRRLVGYATELVENQRFKPGTIDGSTTAIAVELTLGLHTCAEREKVPTDGNFYRFTLRAHPLIALVVITPMKAQTIVSVAPILAGTAEHVGGHISAPNPTVLTDPEIPISRKLPKRGICLLGVLIDANGVPQNIHVVRGLDPELDNNVIEAVKNWRFKPALRDSKIPVAVEGTVAATFEYIDKEPVSYANFLPEMPDMVQSQISRHKTKRPDLDPINADEVIARYMPRSRISGRCIVSLVIDTNGVPRNVRVIKGLDSSLDIETVAMVEHFRFNPVMMDGTAPVPVGLLVPVRYRKMMEKPTGRELFVDALALLFF